MAHFSSSIFTSRLGEVRTRVKDEKVSGSNDPTNLEIDGAYCCRDVRSTLVFTICAHKIGGGDEGCELP